ASGWCGRRLQSDEGAMNSSRLQFLTIASLVMLFLSTKTPAQRSFTTAYDPSRKVTLEGVVTKVDWVNPRAFLFINVRDASGTLANWAVEFGNPVELERNGWKSSSLKIGDTVTVQGVAARSDPRQAAATSLALKASGQTLVVAPPAAARPRPAAAPRWPNGHVR